MSSHMIRGRQLSRDTEHRKSLRRSLAQSLFEHGKIRTTLPKAKEVKSFVEKLITLAKTAAGAPGDKDGKALALASRRRAQSYLNDRRLVDESQEFTGETVCSKLFKEIAPKFADRSGGYTRIIKTSKHRIGDGGTLVYLELVLDGGLVPKGTIRRSAGLRRKRNEKRHQFAAKALKKGTEKAPAETPKAE